MKQINFPYWKIYLLLCCYTILLWKRAHLLRHHICWGLTDTNKNCDQSSSNMAKNLTSGKMNMDVHIEKLIRPPNYFRNYQKSSFVHGNIQEELKPGRQSCLNHLNFHTRTENSTGLFWHDMPSPTQRSRLVGWKFCSTFYCVPNISLAVCGKKLWTNISLDCVR